ncbi:hypothetical protein P9112_004388 [Eukaryota sp. TZLM1-RC]
MSSSEASQNQEGSQQSHASPEAEADDTASDHETSGFFVPQLYEFWSRLSTLVGNTLTEVQEIESEYTSCVDQLNNLKGDYTNAIHEIHEEKEHIATALQSLVSSASAVLGFGSSG